MAEADLMRHLQKLASSVGARLFRQNSGMGWIGNKVIRGPATVRLAAGDVVIRNARPFHSGFDGWSDLGGFVPVTITAEHVSSTLAVYTQVEVKFGTGRTTQEQRDWIAAVKRFGGRAGVARTDDDLLAILRGDDAENKQSSLL